jgi:hypothetical protein
MPNENAPAREGEGATCQLGSDASAYSTGPAPDQFSTPRGGVRPGPILRRHWLRGCELLGVTS